MDSNDMPANLNNLPASLKYLHLHCWLSSKTDFYNLPESLEELVTLNFTEYLPGKS